MDTTNENASTVKILRRPEVEARTGLRKSHLYELAKRGDFPKPIQLWGRSVGWVESEVNAWLEARIAASRAGV